MSKKNKERVKKPDLDIIIPVFSNFETLEKSLQAIPKACGDLDYRIYIVDDVSPDYEEKGKAFYTYLRQNLDKLGGIMIQKQNGGFGKTCNTGFAMGRAEQVMFMSTDVLLFEESAKIMTEHLMGSPEIGVTFPKLLFFPNSTDINRPANKIQAVGIVFDILQRPYHIFNGWNSNHPFVNRVRDMNAFTGACFVIRRGLFHKIGGFDINFGRGTCEDVALSLMVRKMGLKIRYLPQAIGYHFVGMSAILTNTPFPIDQNMQYLKLKYGNLIPFDDWIFAA